MTWTPAPLPLLQPLRLDDGTELDTLTLRAFTVGDHRAAIKKAGKDEDEQFEVLAAVATGLTTEQVGTLCRPDYISLSKRIFEYLTTPTAAVLGRELDPDDFELLVPYRSAGRDIERARLVMPAVKTVKLMRAHKTPEEQTDFITCACTGLLPHDLPAMSVPDWIQLQGRLDDFLNKPADYFRKAIST